MNPGTAFLDGGGRMGALMRSHDWTRSPLGDPQSWPGVLKAAIATCLASRFPMVIWWGPQLLMFYNDAWQPILGETKHPAGLGRPGAESWPETWPIVGQQFEQALGGVASWSEDLLLASDRQGFLEECYFTYSHSPLKDSAGTVVGVHSVVSETTARVLTERRLRILGTLSQTIVEATGQGASLVELCQTLLERLCAGNPDVPFAVLYLTQPGGGARRIVATVVEASLFPAEVDDAIEDEWGLRDALRHRTGIFVDHSSSATRLPGGSWSEATTQTLALPLPRTAAGSEACGVLLVGLNERLHLDSSYADFLGLAAAQLGAAVSALQLIAEERSARTSAERAARLRDEFLAMLSHELRSPLNAVSGWAQILKNEIPPGTRAAVAVEVIDRNAGLQARLITDLLDVSRAISGNLTLDLQPIDLPSSIDAAIESVMPAASAKGVAIEKSIGPTPTIQGEPGRIQQMLGNLLANGVKFAARGGRVEVSARELDHHVEIRVSDDGEGIDPAFLPHVFERFRQADPSRSRRHGGLGLGLAIVKQFAELHGGRVRAQSDGIGQGATFILELPHAGAANGYSASLTDSAPDERYDVSKIRVLVIDDQTDALRMIRRILEDGAASVRTASSAKAALEILLTDTFDVIVSDIAMPDLDGYGFVAELRRRGLATPKIALTAFALSDDRRKALSVGYDAHLTKPVDAQLLLATIARLANLKEDAG